MHYTFGTKEEPYRAVMEQLTQNLVAQVEQVAPTGASFEDTIVTLTEALALWRTVLEQPASYQLLNELTVFACVHPTSKKLFTGVR